MGIGSNFLALYVYYLACPLHFLGALVPKAHIMEFLSYLVVCKVGLCGLTACLYLQRHFHTRSFSCVLFSCFYALSGFMAAYNWNIMWLDPVILLPLVLLGLERLVKEGRCGLYCVALALSIYTNFYLSIMVCIFLVLYFLVLLFTEKRSVKILGNFALFSLLAGGMAAMLLVPEICALLATDFGHSSFPAEVKTYFSVLAEPGEALYVCLGGAGAGPLAQHLLRCGGLPAGAPVRGEPGDSHETALCLSGPGGLYACQLRHQCDGFSVARF